MVRQGSAPAHGAARGRNLHDSASSHDGTTSRVLTLWTHEPPNFSRHDFVMNPAYGLAPLSDTELMMVTSVADWEMIQVAKQSGADMSAACERAIVFKPVQAYADQEVIARQKSLQLSIAQSIASLGGLSSRQSVVLSRTLRAQHRVSNVELYFKDQYMGRADMWRLSLSLLDTCIYVGQTITLPTGLRARIGRLFTNERTVVSGLVTAATKPIFRSESARVSVFLQMSREMWEFDEGGEIHYEKVIQGFLPDLLQKWRAVGTHHVVSIVLFTRVLYDDSDRPCLKELPVQRTECGQLYVDYYKVVLELDSECYWPRLLRVLKEELFRFQHDILLQPRGAPSGAPLGAPPLERGGDRAGGHVLLGRFAPAHHGNLLEALNLELNATDKQYIDRDLTRTGFILLVVTAGSGHFYVNKNLLRLTTQRMLETGVAVDLVCATQMPLHTVPVFHYLSGPPSDRRIPSRALQRPTDLLFCDTSPHGPQQMYHSMPYWVNGSFYNVEKDRPHTERQFVPRCRMDSLRMMEMIGSGQQELALPYLALPTGPHGPTLHAREQFDRDVFAPVETSARSANVAAPLEASLSSAGTLRPSPDRTATPVLDSAPAWSRTPQTGAAPPHMSGLQRSRTLSIASSRMSGRVSVLDEPGKAAAMVGATVTELVATSTTAASAASSTASLPHGDERRETRAPSLWRRLFMRRGGPAAVRANATAGDAARLLSEALGRPDTPSQDAVLLVHSSRDATHIATRYDDEPPISASPDEAVDLGPGSLYDGPRLDPTNPRSALSEPNLVLLRWQHIFLERASRHTIQWRSMSTPACLPLTTRYLPSEHELATSWHEYPYTVSVHSDTASIMLRRSSSTSPALAMLREMCAQRLLHGFQLVERAVLRPGAAPGTRDACQFVLRHTSELLRPGNFADGDPIYLSTMNQVHCISYHRPSSMIHVTRYVQKTPYSTAPLSYQCCIWPRHQAGYHTVPATFHYPDPHAYNWTYLDSMIAGYEDRFIDALRYSRARFVVVPSEGSPPSMLASSGESLSDEEVRLQGMDRLADLFTRAEYYPAGAPRRERTQPLRFLPTTLDPTSSMHDEQFLEAISHLYEEQSQRNYERRRPHREASKLSLAELAEELRGASKELKVHDRLWHRVLHTGTFTGADLVSWLCRAYSDVHTRDEAVQLGRRLHEAGYLEHVFDAHGLLDGHYFYRWTRVDERPPAGDVLPSPRRRPRPRRRLHLSRSMLVDVDPSRRSNRAEIAVLHHDLAHNAENGFNFQVHWLGTTSRLIDDLVQSWTRTVERYGLRLVEAPIEQIKDAWKQNPFQAPVPITLALAPPKRESYQALLDQARDAQAHRVPEPRNEMEAWLFRHVLSHYATQADLLFENALMRRFSFVLDQEAHSLYPAPLDLHYSSRPNNFEYTQFVHRSGVAFVQVLGGQDGFLWLSNRLFNPHCHTNKNYSGKAAPPPHADHVLRAFRQMCGDKDALRAFYGEVWDALTELAQLAS